MKKKERQLHQLIYRICTIHYGFRWKFECFCLILYYDQKIRWSSNVGHRNKIEIKVFNSKFIVVKYSYEDVKIEDLTHKDSF